MNIDLSGWKAPNLGPPLHGLVVFLATEGLPILRYINDSLSGGTANWDWDRFLVGMIPVAITVLISAGRNKGAVAIPSDSIEMVKGVPMVLPDKEVVVTQADRIIPNSDPVMVVRAKRSVS